MIIFLDNNSVWTISNNQPVIDALNKRNRREKVTSILCFDYLPL